MGLGLGMGAPTMSLEPDADLMEGWLGHDGGGAGGGGGGNVLGLGPAGAAQGGAPGAGGGGGRGPVALEHLYREDRHTLTDGWNS